MTKGFMHWEDTKARALGLFWVTARQVVWRSQPHGASCLERREPEDADAGPRTRDAGRKR